MSLSQSFSFGIPLFELSKLALAIVSVGGSVHVNFQNQPEPESQLGAPLINFLKIFYTHSHANRLDR